jgi:phosphoribosylformylglycinamidine synthase subunit PurQ / glutaminase
MTPKSLGKARCAREKPGMSKKLSAIVMAGNGTNCERETAHACISGGFERVDIVTIWELVAGEKSLVDYDFLCLPGGFLDGDDLGSAKAQANRLLHATVKKTGKPLFDQFLSFIGGGKCILGICNGFQLMVKLGLLPAFDKNYRQQTVTLTSNDSGMFEDRWVWLKADPDSPCIYTSGVDKLYLPVRHGEGKFVTRDDETLKRLKFDRLATLRYIDPNAGEPTLLYPDNPNGSVDAIAGVCDPTGRLFGLMPHPEANMHRTNHPRWTREPSLPEEGMGCVLFRNAYEFIRKSL